ncbi:PrsW family intramembrane metalloprotease [Euzebya sp.]|uniref:PrsW family intramembrane metalloprotease n=1 Tax=Euzebya sp. TaxID=1971409 RepID=UPI0035132CE8
MDLFWLALAGAVVPCLAWLWFFYTRDVHDPEPKPLIAKLFLIGALPVAFVAGIVNTGLLLGLTGGDLRGAGATAAFATFAVLGAPVVEETLKYLGTSVGARRHRAFDEPVDGMIYGATVGLGFAAAETVDYLINAYQGFGPLGTPIDFCDAGAECFLLTAFLRGIGSAVLHATAGGIAGYGLSRRVVEGRGRPTAIWWVLVAMVAHGAWNAAAFVTLPLPALVFFVLLRRSLRRSPYVAEVVVPRRYYDPARYGDPNGFRR